MGYYGDCRDCIHKSSIHRAGSGHECEFICGYSKVEMDDVYGDPCCNFQDAAAVQAAQQREKDRKDAEAFVTGWYLGEHADDLAPCVVGIIAVIIAVGIWERLSMSDSPISITIKGLISLYILYKIFLKWIWKFLSFIYKEMCEQATRNKIDTFCATLVTSLFVTWIFTWVYDVRYFFESYIAIAFLIHRFCFKSLMKALHEKLRQHNNSF